MSGLEIAVVAEQTRKSVKFASRGRTTPYLYKERWEIGVESSENRFFQRTGARRLGLNSKFPLFRGLSSRIGEGSEAEQRMFSPMVKKSVLSDLPVPSAVRAS